jgi:hypothetical protein
VQVTISGFLQNTLSGNSANAQLYFGTSTAPSNGVSVTGTAVGAVLIGGATCTSCNWAIPMTLTAVITGLTPGTAYWFDVGLLSGNASGTSIIGNVAGTIVEF